MRYTIPMAVLIILFACASSKKTGTGNSAGQDQHALLLTRKLPVYVSLYSSKGVLSQILRDSLEVLGFKSLDSGAAYRLYQESMFAVLQPRNPKKAEEIVEKSKTDKNYIQTLWDQASPVYQHIYVSPKKSEDGYLIIVRDNPLRTHQREFRIPYSETESVEELMTKVLDSLIAKK